MNYPPDTTRTILCPICGAEVSIPAEVPGTHRLPFHEFGPRGNMCGAMVVSISIERDKCTKCGVECMSTRPPTICLRCYKKERKAGLHRCTMTPADIDNLTGPELNAACADTPVDHAVRINTRGCEPMTPEAEAANAINSPVVRYIRADIAEARIAAAVRAATTPRRVEREPFSFEEDQ